MTLVEKLRFLKYTLICVFGVIATMYYTCFGSIGMCVFLLIACIIILFMNVIYDVGPENVKMLIKKIKNKFLKSK